MFGFTTHLTEIFPLRIILSTCIKSHTTFLKIFISYGKFVCLMPDFINSLFICYLPMKSLRKKYSILLFDWAESLKCSSLKIPLFCSLLECCYLGREVETDYVCDT